MNIEALLQVRKDIGNCTRCGLHSARTNIVFGEGNPFSKIMFIGEGPGESEDLSGRPFVGRSGKLLDQALERAGLNRDLVYIANIVKCRPPGNRDPLPIEKETCSPFLDRQINTINPKILMPLGRISGEYILGRQLKITRERGQLFEWPKNPQVKVIVAFHPSYVLRNRSTEIEDIFYEDVLKVKKIADEIDQTAYATAPMGCS